MVEVSKVHCAKEDRMVPIWWCVGSFWKRRARCPELIVATIAEDYAKVKCKAQTLTKKKGRLYPKTIASEILTNFSENETASSLARKINYNPKTIAKYLEMLEDVGFLKCDKIKVGSRKISTYTTMPDADYWIHARREEK